MIYMDFNGLNIFRLSNRLIHCLGSNDMSDLYLLFKQRLKI